jgi:hypothetical protein
LIGINWGFVLQAQVSQLDGGVDIRRWGEDDP